MFVEIEISSIYLRTILLRKSFSPIHYLCLCFGHLSSTQRVDLLNGLLSLLKLVPKIVFKTWSLAKAFCGEPPIFHHLFPTRNQQWCTIYSKVFFFENMRLIWIKILAINDQSNLGWIVLIPDGKLGLIKYFAFLLIHMLRLWHSKKDINRSF